MSSRGCVPLTPEKRLLKVLSKGLLQVRKRSSVYLGGGLKTARDLRQGSRGAQNN